MKGLFRINAFEVRNPIIGLVLFLTQSFAFALAIVIPAAILTAISFVAFGYLTGQLL